MAETIAAAPAIADICHKYALTVEEMAVLSGIGENSIRDLIKNDPIVLQRCILKRGNRNLIKRERFFNYLDGKTEI